MQIPGLRRLGALALLAALAGASAANAAPPAPLTPQAIIVAQYRMYVATEHLPGAYTPPTSLYTPRLRALMAKSTRDAHGEEGCGEDFGWWVNAQDYEITDVHVNGEPTGARATVTATFVNLHTPQTLRFSFQQIGGRWLIDDIASVQGDRWLLSKLLQCQ
jgi:hypothetical protein